MKSICHKILVQIVGFKMSRIFGFYLQELSISIAKLSPSQPANLQLSWAEIA